MKLMNSKELHSQDISTLKQMLDYQKLRAGILEKRLASSEFGVN